MNLPYFISRKIIKANPGSFSSIINKVAIVSVALGLATMIIAFLILEGFENTIRDKIYSFSGHYVITKYRLDNSFEELPIPQNTDFYKQSSHIAGVEHVQVYAHKAGLVKANDEVQGVIFKGIDKDFDSRSFKANMVEGTFLNFADSATSNKVVISKRIANQLKLHVKDKMFTYFIQNPPRYRNFEIIGIYETSLDEFDKQYIIGDISVVQKLNNWGDSLIGGYEVFINDLDKINEIEETVLQHMDVELYLERISDKYIQVFDWLSLLNRNVNILLVLILFVACFNMVAILVILIMERTQMIGILKSLGARDKQIRRIFYYNGFLLVLQGIILGNVIGLGFCYIQYKFEIISLDPENYYMKTVPIYWDWIKILLLNVVASLVVAFVMIFPTWIISRIQPVKAIKFD